MRCCAEFFVHRAAGISEIVAELDSCNDSGEDIAPVFPHELIYSKMNRPFRSLKQRYSRLKRCLLEEQTSHIDKDFTKLHRSYLLETEAKSAIDTMREKVISLQDVWAPKVSRFAMPKEFYGGISTVLSNTATVKVEFSLFFVGEELVPQSS